MPGENPQRGFTMIEVLVASAIFGVVMVATFTLFASNQDAYRQGLTDAEVQQNARVALQAMVREVRMAGYDLSGVVSSLTPPSAVQVANLSHLTFVADTTGDGVLDRVTFRLDGARVVRELSSWDGAAFPAATASTVAEGIDLLSFTYLDADTPTNNTIAAPVAAAELGDIRRITITLRTSRTSFGDQATFSLVVDVRLRN